jgi:hypothetical protein
MLPQIAPIPSSLLTAKHPSNAGAFVDPLQPGAPPPPVKAFEDGLKLEVVESVLRQSNAASASATASRTLSMQAQQQQSKSDFQPLPSNSNSNSSPSLASPSSSSSASEAAAASPSNSVQRLSDLITNTEHSNKQKQSQVTQILAYALACGMRLFGGDFFFFSHSFFSLFSLGFGWCIART